MRTGASDELARAKTGPWLPRLVGYVWAAPVTLIGLLLSVPIRLGGGQWQCHSGVLEVWDGPVARWLLQGGRRRILAITLGHVVLAPDRYWLERTRAHERVHVAQTARWGVMFPLAYAVASLLAWWRGEPAYRGNRFEQAAYRVHDPLNLATESRHESDITS